MRLLNISGVEIKVEGINKKKLIDGRMAILLGGHAVAVMLLMFVLLSGQHGGDEKQFEQLKTVAIKLQSAGLVPESIDAYKDYYFSIPTNQTENRAKISFLIADLYSSVGRKNESVRWYYQTIESGFVGNETDESKIAVVKILEEMGKLSAAKSVLAEATALTSKSKLDKSESVVATIDNTKLFLHQIDSTLDRLPESIKKNFETLEGKKNLLSQMVSKELVYQRGKRLGLDLEKEQIESLEEIKKEMVVNKVLEKEFKEKVKVSEDDLKNYFQANIEKYKDKKSKKVPLLNDVKTVVEMDYQNGKKESVYRDLVQELYKTSKVELFLEKVK